MVVVKHHASTCITAKYLSWITYWLLTDILIYCIVQAVCKICGSLQWWPLPPKRSPSSACGTFVGAHVDILVEHVSQLGIYWLWIPCSVVHQGNIEWVQPGAPVLFCISGQQVSVLIVKVTFVPSVRYGASHCLTIFLLFLLLFFSNHLTISVLGFYRFVFIVIKWTPDWLTSSWLLEGTVFNETYSSLFLVSLFPNNIEPCT